MGRETSLAMQRLGQRLGFGLVVGASSPHARVSVAPSPHIAQHRLFASFSAIKDRPGLYRSGKYLEII
jgi:hypothetical protein